MVSMELAREEDTTNSACGMNLHSQSFEVHGVISSTCEISKIKLNLVPAFFESHRHRADERLDSGCPLIYRGSESSLLILIVKHLHFERKVLLQILYLHHKVR